jgi:hypothetical protein
VFSGDASAYPIYLTIGNISKSLRRKPSQHAQVLLGYLPNPDLSGLPDITARTVRARLFHSCMRRMIEPLNTAGLVGCKMTSGDGAVRSCHPILACYVADYPEQCLVTCTRQCPVCHASHNSLGDHIKDDSDQEWDIRDHLTTLHHLRHASTIQTATAMEEYLKNEGLTHVIQPFWEGLPHCNIHSCITPDILHQLYQGLIKHLISWLIKLVGRVELDARFKRLPQAHGVRLFIKGITGLIRVSGTEHKHICRQLLGCLVGAPGVPIDAIKATRALLDFLYIAQYQSHSESTLTYLSEALDEFHKYKDIFIRMDARSRKFNLFSLVIFACYTNPAVNLFRSTFQSAKASCCRTLPSKYPTFWDYRQLQHRIYGTASYRSGKGCL